LVGRFFGGTTTLRDTVETSARKAAAADEVTARAASAAVVRDVPAVSPGRRTACL
jgi:hypothetical protein